MKIKKKIIFEICNIKAFQMCHLLIGYVFVLKPVWLTRLFTGAEDGILY